MIFWGGLNVVAKAISFLLVFEGCVTIMVGRTFKLCVQAGYLLTHGSQDFRPPIHLTDSDFAVITQVGLSEADFIRRPLDESWQKFYRFIDFVALTKR